MTSAAASAALKRGPLPDNRVDGVQQWPAELCKGMIERSPWPMFVIDCESGRFVEANNAALRKYKMNREDFLASELETVVLPEDRELVNQLLHRGLAGPVREELANHVLPDGSTIPVEVASFPLLWHARPSRFTIIRDPMPRDAKEREAEQEAEEELKAAIARPIAHDFNNLLTVLLAIAEQLGAGEGDPEQQVALLAKAIRNAQELAQERLNQGHKHSARRERMDMNALLRNEADLLGAVLGKRIDLQMQLDDDLWPVYADAGQWRESLLNLAVNARDAMPESGTFYLSTRRALLASDDAKLGLSHGRYVHLVVRDTGQGMTEETLLHAFEPYYTTKPREQNSGLGLASVHGMIRQSGGAIRLTSAPGEGARFDIFIPAQNEDVQMAPTNGLLLLVEDEDELRKLIQDFLAARGYEVIACGSAEAALKWTRSLTRTPDAVISDVALPEGSGNQLVKQIRQQSPETKVVFMSGYAEPKPTISEVDGAIYLQKPFSLHHLASTLSQLLSDATQPHAG